MTLPPGEKVIRHLFMEIAGAVAHEVVVRYIFKLRIILQSAYLLSSNVINQQRAFQKVFFELSFGGQQRRIIQGFAQKYRVFRTVHCPVHNADIIGVNAFYVGIMQLRAAVFDPKFNRI